jgi:hypothetical protein
MSPLIASGTTFTFIADYQPIDCTLVLHGGLWKHVRQDGKAHLKHNPRNLWTHTPAPPPYYRKQNKKVYHGYKEVGPMFCSEPHCHNTMADYWVSAKW